MKRTIMFAMFVGLIVAGTSVYAQNELSEASTSKSVYATFTAIQSDGSVWTVGVWAGSQNSFEKNAVPTTSSYAQAGVFVDDGSGQPKFLIADISKSQRKVVINDFAQGASVRSGSVEATDMFNAGSHTIRINLVCESKTTPQSFSSMYTAPGVTVADMQQLSDADCVGTVVLDGVVMVKNAEADEGPFSNGLSNQVFQQSSNEIITLPPPPPPPTDLPPPPSTPRG